MKRIILIILVLGGIFLAAYWYMGYSYNKGLQWTSSNTKTPVSIQIEQGSSSKTIANILKENNLIRDSWVFEWYVKDEELAHTLQAGSFIISTNKTIPEIVDILTGKVKSQEQITIPEGYTVAQIDNLLTEKGLITQGEFIACTKTCDFSSFELLPKEKYNPLEGYLFPDTYFINVEAFSVKDFIDSLLTNFHSKMEPYHETNKMGAKEVDTYITMASMIEREAITEEERPIISGILWKRRDEGIPLGVDATSRYAKESWSDDLTYQDLQSDTPFNTRLYPGLPPTPISNPGIKSIDAAFNPQESPYYYYLHDKNGQIHYGRTHDEHVENKRKYL